MAECAICAHVFPLLGTPCCGNAFCTDCASTMISMEASRDMCKLFRCPSCGKHVGAGHLHKAGMFSGTKTAIFASFSKSLRQKSDTVLASRILDACEDARIKGRAAIEHYRGINRRLDATLKDIGLMAKTIKLDGGSSMSSEALARVLGEMRGIRKDSSPEETVKALDAVERALPQKTLESPTWLVKCQHTGCPGVVSSDGECPVCRQHTCLQCEAVLDADHVCDEAEVASIAVKKSQCRCPKCGIYIQKASGCNQMFCTNCRHRYIHKPGDIGGAVAKGTTFHNPEEAESSVIGYVNINGGELRQCIRRTLNMDPIYILSRIGYEINALNDSLSVKLSTDVSAIAVKDLTEKKEKAAVKRFVTTAAAGIRYREISRDLVVAVSDAIDRMNFAAHASFDAVTDVARHMHAVLVTEIYPAICLVYRDIKGRPTGYMRVLWEALDDMFMVLFSWRLPPIRNSDDLMAGAPRKPDVAVKKPMRKRKPDAGAAAEEPPRKRGKGKAKSR